MADFPSYFYPVTELIDCIRVFECPQWEDLSNSTEQYTTGAEETGGEKRWKQNTEEEKKKQAGDRKKNQFCKQIIATFFSISQINDYLLFLLYKHSFSLSETIRLFLCLAAWCILCMFLHFFYIVDKLVFKLSLFYIACLATPLHHTCVHITHFL